ncbi:MAG: hypothetical protein E7A37_06240 [Negativicoccus succinicivorans]|nr:hypothetical protein [Negativicoccus succinicivorans]
MVRYLELFGKIFGAVWVRSLGPFGKIFGDMRLSKPLPCKGWQPPKKVLKSYLKKLKKKTPFSFLTDKQKSLPAKNKKRQAMKGNYE